MEQSLRRADFPLAFSEGFNPRPKISFPTALPLGISSDDEIMSIQLSEWLKPEEILQQLNKQLISGVTITSVEPLSRDTPPNFCVIYKITPLSDNFQLTEDRIKNWFSQPSQIVQRDYLNKDSKSVNLKDYVQKIELRSRSPAESSIPIISGKDGSIFLTIKITNQGTARPEEVINSLGIEGSLKDGSFTIHKLKTLIP